jgi:hypothetical protein
MNLLARELAEDFLLNKILPNIKMTFSGCWEWEGTKQAQGYDRYKIKGRKYSVHRAVYQIVNGVQLTSKIFVCHSCDNPSCCNPDHLWLGTPQDNVSDMVAKGRYTNWNSLKTHCKHGHEFTPENTYPKGGTGRQCKTCRRRIDVERRRKRRENNQ